MRNILYAAVFSLTCIPLALYAEDWVSLEKTGGKGLFQEKCGMCHADAMGMGTGLLARRLPADQALLENREDLQAPFIKNVVRAGYGVMFPISRSEVSDSQLEAISEYLAGED
jgi:mono/diheme cytochrome c family protein